MLQVILLIGVGLPLIASAPLYGEDGGYRGQASYVPMEDHLRNYRIKDDQSTLGSDESDLDLTGDILRSPHKSDQSGNSEVLPKNYDILHYIPKYEHGYGNNKLSTDTPVKGYQKATLFGKGSYKMADTYQRKNINALPDNQHDYKDDYLPQPYNFGFKLKDKDGNEQHREESSDADGSVKGSYGYVDESGIYRRVEYEADKEGFRAKIKTNEPGTFNENPADVEMDVDPEALEY